MFFSVDYSQYMRKHRFRHHKKSLQSIRLIPQSMRFQEWRE